MTLKKYHNPKCAPTIRFQQLRLDRLPTKVELSNKQRRPHSLSDTYGLRIHSDRRRAVTKHTGRLLHHRCKTLLLEMYAHACLSPSFPPLMKIMGYKFIKLSSFSVNISNHFFRKIYGSKSDATKTSCNSLINGL